MSLRRISLYTIGFLIVASLAGGTILVMRLNTNQPVEITISAAETKGYSGRLIIEGAINNPGIFPITEDDRITGLLEAARLHSDADLNRLRLYVPRTGETDRPQLIDINRADTWLLQALPGIGEVRAKAIVEYRKVNGPFRSAEDLLKVNGISPATLERIRPLITLGS